MDAIFTPQRTNRYKPGLACFAGLGSLWVFVLVTLGAFTTSIGAGMAFPDWPLSNGSLSPTGWLENLSMFAEHSHRLSGTVMGLITIALAYWVWRTEARRWVRRLCGWALALVILQGLIGGQRVKLNAVAVPGFQMSLGEMLRIPHGVLAQIYVCVLLAVAVACSRSWIERAVPVRPAVRRAGFFCCGLLFLQLIIAATMRHNGAGLAIRWFPFSTEDHHLLPTAWDFRVAIHFAHRVMAAILAVALSILVWFVRRDPGATPAMKAAASILISLLLLQILLGAEIIWTLRRAEMTTGHVLVGALTLATTFWLTLVANRDAIEAPSP